MPDEQKIEVSQLFVEMAMGAATIAAFVLSRLEAKGVLDHAETAKALKDAVAMIPKEMEGHPRYNPLVALHVLEQDKAMRHALPFDWK